MEDRALPPKWPLDPASLEAENLTYDLRSVPLDSISMVTSETMKVCKIFARSSHTKLRQVDATGIVDHHRKSLMLEILNSLQILVHNWRTAGTIPEVNWDRIRTLDFQEALRSRNDLAKRRQGSSCTLCAEFHDHVSSSHFHAFI
jgi:antiviral helicase SKI2